MLRVVSDVKVPIVSSVKEFERATPIVLPKRTNKMAMDFMKVPTVLAGGWIFF